MSKIAFTDLTIAPWSHNPSLLMCATSCNDFFPSIPYTAEARDYMVTLLDAHPIRMVTLSNMRTDCEVYRALVEGLTQRGFTAVAQQANWTQFELLPSSEPTSCGCGSADCPLCCYNQPERDPDADLVHWVIECMERYGQPPADLVILCRDCGQEVCCCWEDDEPDPNAPELNQDARDRLTEQDGVQFDEHGMVISR